MFTHLHDLQLLQALLHQLLYISLLRLGDMFPKGIYCSSLCIFSKVVCCELAGCAEEGTELSAASCQRCNSWTCDCAIGSALRIKGSSCNFAKMARCRER